MADKEDHNPEDSRGETEQPISRHKESMESVVFGKEGTRAGGGVYINRASGLALFAFVCYCLTALTLLDMIISMIIDCIGW